MLIIFFLLSINLEPQNYGEFVFFLSISAICYALQQFGDVIYGLKNCTPENHSKPINDIFVSRCINTVIITVIVILIYPYHEYTLVSFIIILMLLECLNLDFLYRSFDYYKALIVSKFGLFILVSLIAYKSSEINIIELILMYLILFKTFQVFVLLLSFFRKIHLNDISLPSKQFYHSAIPMGISMIALTLYYHSDKILIKFYLGSEQLAVYDFALRLYAIPMFLNSLFWQFFAPKLKKNRPKFYKYGLYLIMIMPVSYLLLLNLEMLNSSELFSYELSSQVIFLILVTLLNTIICSPLLVLGEERLHAKASMIAVMVNMLINILLLPIYGISIAVFSTVAAEATILIVVLARAQLYQHERKIFLRRK